MSKDDCESVSYFLLLIRNIVHAPEGVRANQSASVGDSATYFAAAASPGHWQQRRLLSDLLTQGLDLLLIDLLTCSQKVGETGVKWDSFCFPPISPKLII
jgi:hypothetical protein